MEEIREETVTEELVTEEESTSEEEAQLENLEEKEEKESTTPGIDDDLGAATLDESEAQEPVPEEGEKIETVPVIGVRFRAVGKIYYFSPGTFQVKRGSHVIVETARGVEYGTVVCNILNIDKRRFKAPLKEIMRVATTADTDREEANREREHEALKICRERIRRHNLDMKLIAAEYTFDNSKILFYFTADGRVDFRDLVKDLAGVFHTRIELRQIGVRDETKILGGYGICGRPLCCHTYLTDFIPVSIKMAKEQNLSLNPSKISGVCGRLMCCLKNEEDTYEELNKNLPRVGDEVQGNDGLQGEVESVSVLRQRVRIIVDVNDEKELHEYDAGDITVLRHRKRGQAKPKFRRDEVRVDSSVTGARPPRPAAPAKDFTKEAAAPAEAAKPEKPERPDRPKEGRRGNPRQDREGRQQRGRRRDQNTDPSQTGRKPAREQRPERPDRKNQTPQAENKDKKQDGTQQQGARRHDRRRRRGPKPAAGTDDGTKS